LIGFYNLGESVYSAVRADSLYKADYVLSLKGQPFNIGIKSLRATLPDEIFTGDFAS
jgi:hypothetical protein